VQRYPIATLSNVLKFDDIAVISQILIPKLAGDNSSLQASISRSQFLAN
jgi:hypothetical protein